MNSAHIHLILNHIPILGLPIGLLLFAYASWKKNSEMKRFSYLFVLGVAAIVIPVFLTGEPAEEVVEHLPGVSENLIEAHEEAGELALVLTLVAGGLALLSLLIDRLERLSGIRRPTQIVYFLSLVSAIGSLAYTGNLGGQIRHTELRAENAGISGEGESGEGAEGSEGEESEEEEKEED